MDFMRVLSTFEWISYDFIRISVDFTRISYVFHQIFNTFLNILLGFRSHFYSFPLHFPLRSWPSPRWVHLAQPVGETPSAWLWLMLLQGAKMWRFLLPTVLVVPLGAYVKLVKTY